jgi:hypothetical protein
MVSYIEKQGRRLNQVFRRFPVSGFVLCGGFGVKPKFPLESKINCIFCRQRAERLQEAKQAEALQREARRSALHQRELQLIAKNSSESV